uniref:Uncharacterized protein n=1 Tax=Oryza punctata TaxID=4537 RepID=A0A0E0K8J0_ORYPU
MRRKQQDERRRPCSLARGMDGDRRRRRWRRMRQDERQMGIGSGGGGGGCGMTSDGWGWAQALEETQASDPNWPLEIAELKANASLYSGKRLDNKELNVLHLPPRGQCHPADSSLGRSVDEGSRVETIRIGGAGIFGGVWGKEEEEAAERTTRQPVD